jgi:hypothetical protein
MKTLDSLFDNTEMLQFLSASWPMTAEANYTELSFIVSLALLAHITLQYITNKLIYKVKFTFKKPSYCEIEV